jgi:hypothetical protein
MGYFGYVPTFQRNLLPQSLDRVHHDCEATYFSETSALNKPTIVQMWPSNRSPLFVVHLGRFLISMKKHLPCQCDQ